MQKVKGYLRLHCDITNSQYTLGDENNEWREQFATFWEAVQFAQGMSKEDKAVKIYTADGGIMLEGVITAQGMVSQLQSQGCAVD